MWMACYSTDEIAEACNVGKATVSEICSEAAELPESNKPAADHLTDFQTPSTTSGSSSCAARKDGRLVKRFTASSAGICLSPPQTENAKYGGRQMDGHLLLAIITELRKPKHADCISSRKALRSYAAGYDAGWAEALRWVLARQVGGRRIALPVAQLTW
jgi:hypothetical protein